MGDRGSHDVSNFLRNAPQDQELIFDPQTGRLVVKQAAGQGAGQARMDGVVMTRMAKDGFFRVGRGAVGRV